jgi:hypothetical protein
MDETRESVSVEYPADVRTTLREGMLPPSSGRHVAWVVRAYGLSDEEWETWPIGSFPTIRWTSSGLTGNVKIEVSRNGGTAWALVIASTPNDGAHAWTVMGPATIQARIRVTSVTDPTVADSSKGALINKDINFAFWPWAG